MNVPLFLELWDRRPGRQGRNGRGKGLRRKRGWIRLGERGRIGRLRVWIWCDDTQSHTDLLIAGRRRLNRQPAAAPQPHSKKYC